jgi:DNA-binding LacI/PurR family transcriptional regulator
MAITISDVARLANVSKATVSAVLNGRPGISTATRQRVLDVVERLNYRPNRLARSLSSRETRSIGLIIKEIDNPYFSKVTKGVFDACWTEGYTVLLGSSELSPANEKRCIETLTSQRVDGLILSPLHGEDMDFTFLAGLQHDHYPMVLLGGIPSMRSNVVEIDNTRAAYEAVAYLAGLGHRDIAFWAGPAYSLVSREREKGYREAMMDLDLPVRKDRITAVGSYIENGYRTGKTYFESNSDRPTAVLCYNDLVALGLINALLEMRIPVPDRVSVMGFDDIEMGVYGKVTLTTVRVPAYRIGQEATGLLIRQIGCRDDLLNERKCLDFKLIPRASTGPAGGG